jgi:hypothetical protein
MTVLGKEDHGRTWNDSVTDDGCSNAWMREWGHVHGKTQESNFFFSGLVAAVPSLLECLCIGFGIVPIIEWRLQGENDSMKLHESGCGSVYQPID